jgi:hypothetical protein
MIQVLLYSILLTVKGGMMIQKKGGQYDRGSFNGGNAVRGCYEC